MKTDVVYKEVVDVFSTNKVASLVTGSVFNNPYNGLTVRSIIRKSTSEPNTIERVKLMSPSLGYELCYIEYCKRTDYISNREKDRYASLEDLMSGEGYIKVEESVKLPCILNQLIDLDEEFKIDEPYEYCIFLNVIDGKIHLVELI